MSKQKKNNESAAEAPQQTAQEPETELEPVEEKAAPSELEQAQAALELAKADLAAEHDKLLRLAAEFDNYRSRTTREKERIYADAKAETTEKFLPVYDNLARALATQTADEAYKKGVEMTMQGLLEIMGKLNVEVFGEVGEAFDPAIHNAVMHVEDDSLEENSIVDVFQKGFRLGDKVVRFAMVKVAN